MLLLACAAPSAGQSPFTRTEGGDTVAPITSYPLGEMEEVAKGMLLAMRLERRQRDLCWEYGCLVIVNDSKAFRVTGFHVAERARNGEQRWGPNQFGTALLARKATFRFKTGTQDCDRPVMFVVRHHKTKERLRIEGRANLCSTPHVDTLLRINVVRPEVTVD